MQNEKFNNYDVFHSFLVENADYEGYFEYACFSAKKYIFSLFDFINRIICEQPRYPEKTQRLKPQPDKEVLVLKAVL